MQKVSALIKYVKWNRSSFVFILLTHLIFSHWTFPQCRNSVPLLSLISPARLPKQTVTKHQQGKSKLYILYSDDQWIIDNAILTHLSWFSSTDVLSITNFKPFTIRFPSLTRISIGHYVSVHLGRKYDRWAESASLHQTTREDGSSPLLILWYKVLTLRMDLSHLLSWNFTTEDYNLHLPPREQCKPNCIIYFATTVIFILSHLLNSLILRNKYFITMRQARIFDTEFDTATTYTYIRSKKSSIR